jgi:hypothetical protein
MASILDMSLDDIAKMKCVSVVLFLSLKYQNNLPCFECFFAHVLCFSPLSLFRFAPSPPRMTLCLLQRRQQAARAEGCRQARRRQASCFEAGARAWPCSWQQQQRQQGAGQAV